MLKITLLLVMAFLLGYGVFGLTAREAVAVTVAGASISFVIASFIGLSILAIIATVTCAICNGSGRLHQI